MKKILIVDDERPFRVLVSHLLSKMTIPHDILYASNGKEALSLIAECQPTVVITDIFMPDMDGIELILQLAEQKQPPHIIAITSGSETFQLANHFLQIANSLGSKHAIDKRDINSELLPVVESCLK